MDYDWRNGGWQWKPGLGLLQKDMSVVPRGNQRFA